MANNQFEKNGVFPFKVKYLKGSGYDNFPNESGYANKTETSRCSFWINSLMNTMSPNETISNITSVNQDIVLI